MGKSWYVYVEDCNTKRIERYDILAHSSFARDIKKSLRKCADKEEFAEDLQRDLRYYFWSKVEWEILIGDWPESESFRKEKVDVYDQVMLNFDVFVDYIWEEK